MTDIDENKKVEKDIAGVERCPHCNFALEPPEIIMNAMVMVPKHWYLTYKRLLKECRELGEINDPL